MDCGVLENVNIIGKESQNTGLTYLGIEGNAHYLPVRGSSGNKKGFDLVNWISHLGDTGGDFYTGMGGAQLGGSSPFFRPEIDKVVDTEGYFGGMLGSLGRGTDASSFTSFFADLLSIIDLNSSLSMNDTLVKSPKNDKSFHGTIFTGTELLRLPDGRVNGVETLGKEVFINNLYQYQLDSILIKNKSDSLRYIQEMNNRSDSLLNSMLKR